MSPEKLAVLARRIREERPLVHHLANLVTMADVALLTRALGASPIMAHAPEEVEEIARRSASLCLNLGTPSVERLEVMRWAATAAAEAAVPVVFDPVGAGFTAFRTRLALSLLEDGLVGVVRGNADEVAALAGWSGATHGVESARRAGPELAASLAAQTGACVAVTGRVDYVHAGGRAAAVHNGHPMLPALIGSGCLATATVAAFLAVADDDVFEATTAGLAYFGAAAEMAALEARGPAGLKARLVDLLYGAAPEEIAARARVERLEAAPEP